MHYCLYFDPNKWYLAKSLCSSYCHLLEYKLIASIGLNLWQVEEECQFTTVHEIASAVHAIVGMIQQESMSS